MRANPLIVNWHDQSQPIYSAHFEPSGKGRLATAAGDTNVRLWQVEVHGEERKVEYLATLSKHTQAVNVVRWSPKSETLASAGDDGNVIIWVPSENNTNPAFGSDGFDDKESWRTKHMCRSSGSEIYDLAWSPDGSYFIIGSMDNVARIYNAATGTLVRQIAEHNHYVQGVAWDPLNEYIATQSSDRSVHVYALKTKDGHYSLSNETDKVPRVANHMKHDLPPSRRISSSSPAPPDFGHRSQLAVLDSVPGVSNTSAPIGSPVPSAPGTPTSMALPMNPPSIVSHSRRSSFSSSRRSVSPAPSMPLPAVMPMEASPKPLPASMSMKNSSLYANETLTSFFRRLTFTPDGSLLLTPAGQYQSQHLTPDGKLTNDVVNTVYIYTRGGINKPPAAHLPGHKKPSVCVRCSPIYYTLRTAPPVTKHIAIDTSSSEDAIPALPEPLSKPSPAPSVMDPPPPPSAEPMARTASTDTNATSASSGVPKPAFALPYRLVYAVATQDSILIYDTQQNTPIGVVSNLHCATFTDLAWSSDGATLLVTSSDGFCSAISFSPTDLGEVLKGDALKRRQEAAETVPTSAQTTPIPTPTSQFAPPSPFPGSHHKHRESASSFTAPSPPPAANFVSQRPSSPARSNSTSSIMTQTSAIVTGGHNLVGGSVPGLTATNSGKVTGVAATPPETPRSAGASVAGQKRDLSESESGREESEGQQPKRKRIAPTFVSGLGGNDPNP